MKNKTLMILLGIIAVNLTIQTVKDVGFIPQAEAQQLGILEYDMVTRRVISEVMPTVLRDNAADCWHGSQLLSRSFESNIAGDPDNEGFTLSLRCR